MLGVALDRCGSRPRSDSLLSLARIHDMSPRRTIRAIVIGGAAAVAIHSAPALSWFFPITKRLFPKLMGVRHPSQVALSFDDGPDPVSTPKVLELLEKANVKATFFMLGEMVERYPGVARQVVSAGHEIGVHGLEHKNSLLRSPRTTGYDMAKAKQIIEDVTGAKVKLMRPPYGVISVGTLWYARALQLRIVLWTAWGRDWRIKATAETVIADLRKHGLGGGTILLHDSDCTSTPGSTWSTIGALGSLLEICREARLDVVPIGAI